MEPENPHLVEQGGVGVGQQVSPNEQEGFGCNVRKAKARPSNASARDLLGRKPSRKRS